MSRGKASAIIVVGTADESLETMLGECGLDVVRVADCEQAALRMAATLFDVALVPVGVDRAGLVGLAQLQDACADTPLIAFGPDEPELTRAALRAGASEYLAWPSSLQTVALSVEAASAQARAVAGALPRVHDSGLLGGSPQLATARATLARVAAGTATVLVRGETGTGKELAARAIHAQSPRRDAPFLKVHTPAVPDALLESELFGYEKGAFTGANARKPGRIELAEGGTLFLDEIGEVSPLMQAKLLRLIQDHEYERLGGTRTLRADIRVVAATHRDLEHLVESGAFREDLFYRLNVVSVWLPPLRARREDIRVIALHYLERFGAANGRRSTLDAGALRLLEAERWPGNVRQLVNVIERLVLLCPSQHIGADDVRRGLDEQLEFFTQSGPDRGPLSASLNAPLSAPPVEAAPAAVAPAPAPALADYHFSSAVRPLKEEVRRTELRAITKALQYAKGNRALAARLLGVSRRTLYTKLEELGID
ncbi:MAG TPA: sigma-54 dependent transcriptional regulator [Polyangiaceae bacterium]|nr:sigma-54 dependent transcriptional regulator [Polyangiaceae bacterium]